MAKRKKVSVVQPLGEEIPVEIMAQAIIDIDKGIQALRKSRLTEKAITILIQHSAPTKSDGKRYHLSEINDILFGLDNLKNMYLKKGTVK